MEPTRSYRRAANPRQQCEIISVTLFSQRQARIQACDTITPEGGAVMISDQIVSTVGFIMTITGLTALVAIVAIWAWSAMRS